VQTAYLARGIRLPRDAREQATAGVEVRLEEARPGDLLCFAEDGQHIGHVAMLSERDTIVHATLAMGGVLREPWGPGSRAMMLRPQLLTVRRVD
jgi:cell wall-associated NlpC family hydrolase